MKPSQAQIWFLQTFLNQSAKKFTTYLLEEEKNFDDVLDAISVKFHQFQDIKKKFENHQKSINIINSSRNTHILTRYEIEALRNVPLSAQAALAFAYQGNSSVLSNPTIGIVGSRHPTLYGRLQAQKFAKYLADCGCTIISGGAIGIDAIANFYALQSLHGASVSVIGNGLKTPYPSSNRRLFHKLATQKNGLILSEFPYDETPKKWNFPIRNGSIAELSDFLLVIEATPTSGSLMTAKFARECGKMIGAIPGNVDNPNTTGSHLLIQGGAYCIQQPQDILQYFKR